MIKDVNLSTTQNQSNTKGTNPLSAGYSVHSNVNPAGTFASIVNSTNN